MPTTFEDLELGLRVWILNMWRKARAATVMQKYLRSRSANLAMAMARHARAYAIAEQRPIPDLSRSFFNYLGDISYPTMNNSAMMARMNRRYYRSIRRGLIYLQNN